MWFCILAHHRLLLALKISVRNCTRRRNNSWPRVSSGASFRTGPGPWFPKLTFELQASHYHLPLLSCPRGPYCFLASCGCSSGNPTTQRCLQSAWRSRGQHGVRLPGFKSQLFHFGAVACCFQFPSLGLLMCKMGGRMVNTGVVVS